MNEAVRQAGNSERVRAVFMAAAQEVLDEYGDLIDELEGESGS